MAESSRPWTGTTTGDAGPYSSTNWRQVWSQAMAFAGDTANYGPLRGVGSELAVTATSPVSNQVTLGTGAALVQGAWYYNSASANITIQANGSGNPRIDLIVLQVDYVAQTVRYATLQGTPAVSPAIPNLTQSAGTLWEIPLAQIAVVSGFATIASTDITDRREYANIPNAQGMAALNQSASILQKGSVVVYTTGSSGGDPIDVTTSTTQGSQLACGIIESRAAASGGAARIITRGVTLVLVDSAVAIGDNLINSTTAGQAKTAPTGVTAIPWGRALTASAGAGSVLAFVDFHTRAREFAKGGFFAYASADQTVTSNVTTKITFNSTTFNIGTWYDTATSRFTPLDPGEYFVSFSVSNTTMNAGGLMEIQLNGATYARQWAQSGGALVGHTLATIVPFNGTTDYVEVYLNQTGTNVYKTSRMASFSAIKVGESS